MLQHRMRFQPPDRNQVEPLGNGRTVRLARDQVDDYAARKGTTLEETERWLRPNLGYETRSREEALNR